MKTLVISESQMTFVLKEFLKQYAGSFDHATFDEAGNGYIVHFHQSPEPANNMQAEKEEVPSVSASRNDSDDDPVPSYTPPISITMPDFGGFGGGSSGGAGASGGW